MSEIDMQNHTVQSCLRGGLLHCILCLASFYEQRRKEDDKASLVEVSLSREGGGSVFNVDEPVTSP